MRKLLLIAATLGGLSAVPGTGASAASAVAVPGMDQPHGIVRADWDEGHYDNRFRAHRRWEERRHWDHERWEHRHWRYYD